MVNTTTIAVVGKYKLVKGTIGTYITGSYQLRVT